RGSFVEAYNQASNVKEYFEDKGLVSYAVRGSLVMVGALLKNARCTEADQEKEQLLSEAMLLCRQAALQAHQHTLQEQVYNSQYLLGQLAAARGNLKKAVKHYGAA